MSHLIGHITSEPPFFYDRGEEITVLFRTDREVLESLLPPVLKLPEGPSLAVFRVVRQERSTFGPYIGVYLSAPALLDGQQVNFGLTGMKTSLSGAIAGRDVWGMPLLVGEASMAWQGDVLSVVAGRRGVDFARLTVRLEGRTEPVPGVGLATYASRRQEFEKESTSHVLVSAKGQVEDASEVRYWKASSILKLLGGDPGDDWSLLPVYEIVETRYNQGGRSSLDRGDVLAEW
jgi:hypothetical protein